MREIKFRAWDKPRKQWQYFTLHQLAMGEAHLIWMYLDNWCQYVEREDTNSFEMYEGDIIQDVNNRICEIIYWHEGAKFAATPIDHRRLTFINISDLRLFKKIGNIYENPELLQVNFNQP